MLYLLFRKRLNAEIHVSGNKTKKLDGPMLKIGLAHLAVCTVLLVLSSYIGFDMWMIALIACISLYISNGILCITRKKQPTEAINCFKRAPWELVPFVISMFIIVLALREAGITEHITTLIGNEMTIIKYGFISFFLLT